MGTFNKCMIFYLKTLETIYMEEIGGYENRHS